MRSSQQHRWHGELGGVAGDPDADEFGVGGHIVYTIGHDLVLEVVHVHALRIAFGTIISSAILEVANQFLLGVDGDDGLLFGARKYPVISVDTKKKELVGNFKNGGTDYRPKGDPQRVNVHDFEDKSSARSCPMVYTM